MLYTFLFLILVACELTYFRIADRYNIIDKPNHRSSHTAITIRGGGVIFPLSAILWFLFFGFQYPLVICGLILITFISLIDDLKDISRSLRLLFHLVAVSLAFWQLNLFHFNWYVIALSYIMVVGVINAYNFMDGINGITGVYSLILFATLLWVNQFQVSFISNDLLISLIIGVLVFNFFNFRKKAKCFAGDVGSVSLAFIISFLLLKLILQTDQLFYILLLAVYGIDAVFTIMVRLRKGENIFKAHRLHLYQLLANEKKVDHRIVSSIYGVIQLAANVFIVYGISINSPLLIMGIFIFLILLYLITRISIRNSNRNLEVA
jgi:UDP-GlcNAc:undecaprenyl-phosphate GlcNAc-1-phosphate transferase